MTVKEYEAPNMPEALQQVRADMGERAVILETRRVRRGLAGFLGLRELVQVRAAIDAARRDPPPVVHAWDPRPLHGLSASPSAPGADLAARLAESGVEDALVRRLLKACGPAPSETALSAKLARTISVAPASGTARVRVALVGPTGVGKTTTAAKLAARYALTERKRVALITIDTYRIGAVEQLRIYARVMGLPLEVVHSPEEMHSALDRHADKDAVLIDTVGRSPRRSLQLAEIKAYLNAAEPTETHLVLAAPFGPAYLYEAADHFASLGTDRLIVTKLDEMPRWGVVASLADRTGLPISYITDGQDVPRNLRPANADEIALHILGGGDV